MRLDSETCERLALGGYGPIRGGMTGRVPNKLRELATIRHNSTGANDGIAFLTLGEIALGAARETRTPRSQRAFRPGRAVKFVTRPAEPRRLRKATHSRSPGAQVAEGVFKR